LPEYLKRNISNTFLQDIHTL